MAGTVTNVINHCLSSETFFPATDLANRKRLDAIQNEYLCAETPQDGRDPIYFRDGEWQVNSHAAYGRQFDALGVSRLSLCVESYNRLHPNSNSSSLPPPSKCNNGTVPATVSAPAPQPSKNSAQGAEMSWDNLSTPTKAVIGGVVLVGTAVAAALLLPAEVVLAAGIAVTLAQP